MIVLRDPQQLTQVAQPEIKAFLRNAFMTSVTQNLTTPMSMASSSWLNPVIPQSRLNQTRGIPC